MTGGWWPADLGTPSSVGGQNDQGYAYFPATRRLAIRRGGQVTIYDTLDHQIGGVSQQQGGGNSLSFSSQRGQFQVDSLPVVSGDGAPAPAAPAPSASVPAAPAPAAPAPVAPAPAPAAARPEPTPEPVAAPATPAIPKAPAAPATPAAPIGSSAAGGDPLAMLERLAALREKGILTDEEFAAKKAELLQRL